ncbi:MAG: right-handed parallel beta-helix repeat-containing protein [Planctomycetota bacterium]
MQQTFKGILCLSMVCASILALATSSRAQTLAIPPKVIDPRTPIHSVPYTISSPGSYYLVSNLTGNSGASGITVDADDVTIDMNGFLLLGVAGSLDGIATTTTPRNITIVNGTVRDWGQSGVDLLAAQTICLDRVKSSGNGAAGFRLGSEATLAKCTAEQNGTDGFFFVDDANSAGLSDCIAASNGADGFHSVNTGGVPEPAKAGSFTKCIAKGNADDGFELAGYGLTECSASENSQTGFSLASSLAQNCTAKSNARGFDVTAGTQIQGCSTKDNRSNGVRLEDSKLVDSCLLETIATAASAVTMRGTSSTLKGCRIFQQGTLSHAVFASTGTNLLISDNEIRASSGFHSIFLGTATIGCTVVKNCVEKSIRNDGGANNKVAPTESAANSINPWANLQF